ncbi:MAG TPA: 30S ribosomal protein S2 [Flavobacteriales bacterium]|nr:30S ribosomal protein S2 [Flavobacteriales bacterium]
MAKATFNELLDAGVHFGHLKRKWHPNMAPYIFDEQKGIHIIDLNKTLVKLDEASQAIKQVAKSGKKILFVATKKQAKEIITEKVANINMPFVVERWAGGTLTNFSTIRKSVKKMTNIDKMGADGTLATMSKRERLQVSRQRAKLDKNLGSIADMTRLPAALFVIDIKKEHIAVAEAKKLSIPVFAMVDTNSDPLSVDFAIPSNDDASKSIGKILDVIVGSIVEGLTERKADKASSEKGEEGAEEVTEKKRDIVITDEDDKGDKGAAGAKKPARKGVARKVN